MVQTTKTLLEQINEALKGKIVHWMNLEKVEYGKILTIAKNGSVIVNNIKGDITVLELDQAMLGVAEISSLN